MTKLVAIANPKGGVSKSTISANFAAVSAKRGFHTLLIDLDPQGSSTYLSGIADVDSKRSAGAMFQDEPVPPSELIYTSQYGFDVVPAGSSLIQAEDWLARATMGEGRLRLLLKRDPGLAKYDYIFFDTAGFKGRLLNSVLLACTELYIPAVPSVLTTNEFPDFFELVEEMASMKEAYGDDPLKIGGIIFSMVRESTSAANENISQVREAIEYLNQHTNKKYAMANTMLPVATAIEEAALARAPVVSIRSSSKIAQRYKQLFDELFWDK